MTSVARYPQGAWAARMSAARPVVFFSTTTVPTWVQFNTNPSTYKTATTSIAAGNSENLDLKITVPDETTDFVAKSITVTVQAVAD